MIVSKRVVFPAPLRPSSARLPPAATASETSSTTTASPWPAVTASRRSSSDMRVSEVELAHARVGGDDRRDAFRDHAASGEHRDPLREAEHERHVVLDEQ